MIKEQCTNPEDSSSSRKEEREQLSPPTNADDNEARDTGTYEEDDSQQWILVQHRMERHQRVQNKPLTGTGASDEDLRAAGRTAWLNVGRLRQETTPEAVKRFIDRKGVIGDIVCEELTTLGSNKSYKIEIHFSFLDTTTDRDFWPARIVVRRFRFSRRREGISLEYTTQQSTTTELTMALWNIEGQKSVMNLLPENTLNKYDILVLTETLATETIEISGRYATHAPAQQKAEGRPSCYFNPKLGKKISNT